MSDYGAMIELKKKGEIFFSSSDKELLALEVGKIKSENNFADVLGDGFLFKIGEGSGIGYTYLVIMLSQYWYDGGGDEKESFEFAKENDFAEAEKIAEMLHGSFGQKFEIKAIFDNW
jgi:hypothetical protein